MRSRCINWTNSKSALRRNIKAGYARVSAKDQTVDLQVDALKKAGCIKVYADV